MKQTYINFLVALFCRLCYAFAGAGLLSWVWNYGIAWEFNLPCFGYWLWFAAIMGLRCASVCIHFGIPPKKGA